MIGKAIEPAPFKKNSFYTPVQPTTRPYLLPEIVSLPMTDLFPDMPKAAYVYGDDVSVVRKMTEKALENVDMSMIKITDTVNIICSEHGFNVMGGFAYAEMLKTIKDVVEERTKCEHIRLRSASGNLCVEGVSTLFDFGLIEYFEGKAAGFTPLDEGMYVETEIGKVGVIKAPFDADWFIHTSYSDPREIYFNRNINRVYKAFAMGYAKVETRSAFHNCFGPRSSNIIPFAIFNALSDKHAFTVDLDVTPAGITGVSADNDIVRLNKHASAKILKNYGALFCLAGKIDKVIAIQDCSRWVWYNHCGGMVFGVLLKVHRDLFDLDVVPRNSEGVNGDKIKAIVVNNTTMGGWEDSLWTIRSSYQIRYLQQVRTVT